MPAAGGEAGDFLVLTKAIGTGIVTTANKRALLDEHELEEVVTLMSTLNAGAARAMVECGICRGGSSMMIALALEVLGDRSRDIYLYDTYAGMTRPENVDVRSRDGMEQISRWQAFQRNGYNEWAHASLDEVRANMQTTGYPQDKLHFVEGDVETTIPATAPERISLLRLDTDWYRSTLHELTHLYPRLSQRGALIIDDYGAYEGSRKATDEYFADAPIFLGRIDEAARIGFKWD